MEIITLFGPTAVGKSKLAVELAKEINGEIISADSMQVYRGMDIGTAKLTLEERRGIPHHLIDIHNPDENWAVSDFVEQANQLTGQLANSIIVGGTGLYLWALLEGFSFPIAEANPELRERLEKEPLENLYEKLQEVDPEACKKIHAKDRKRIIRALEVYEVTGKPISKAQTKERKNKRTKELLIGLNLPRDQLYSRINQRVDSMLEKGLIEEVKSLLAKGYSKDLPSMQALGYKEAIEYLSGRWTLDKMIEELKKRTRHFARRQITWFRRFKNVKWFEPPIDIGAIVSYINKV